MGRQVDHIVCGTSGGGGGKIYSLSVKSRHGDVPLFRGTFFLKSAELSVSVFEICAELWVPFWKTLQNY